MAYNLETLRSKIKTFLDGEIALEYWGPNPPEKYWVNFASNTGATALAYPINDINTGPNFFRSRLTYAFTFRFHRNTAYDELPLGIIEDWYFQLTQKFWSGNSYCLFGHHLAIEYESDGSPVKVLIDEGSEDWMIIVEWSFFYTMSYTRAIPN